MADNLVLAVVVFRICPGVALIGLPGGSTFLDALVSADNGPSSIAHAVVSHAHRRLRHRGQHGSGIINLAELAETGSVWTLVYPDFSVAVPSPM